MIPRKYGFLFLFLLALCCARGSSDATSAIYDEKADARRDIASAVAKGEKSKSNIVLIFGANW